MNYKADGTAIQRSLTRDPKDYKTSAMAYPKLAVVLEVRNADDVRNRSAKTQEDRRGYVAEATVFLVDDCGILPNVLITPAVPTGLDNFEEFLPRASTKTVKGTAMDANWTDIDPYDLDGDWCIVEFLNGNIQSPFISRYFPHPRNVYDCATSGKGNPKFSTGKGTALKQQGRYFNRTNGVEFVINKDGDVYLSTARSGNTALMGSKSTDGRFPTLKNGKGGSILIGVKPSQTFEISFDEPVDGIGIGGLPDPSLPQRNPAVPTPITTPQQNTNVLADKQKIVFTTPVAFVVRSEETVMMDAPEIKLGENATDFASKATPTDSNFSALVSSVNAIIAAIKQPMATPSGGNTIPGPSIVALTPLSTPASVKTTKVKVE